MISIIESAGGASGFPRAFLRIGAGSVARHQLALAQRLDCQRIICLARGMSPEVAELQHVAEKWGARFHLAANPLALSGLVTATDEMVVLSDGLYAMPDLVMELLGAGPCVLVQPADRGLAAGFERIDGARASAGILRVPGRLIDQLADLPPDCDIVSSLTRIALQSGIGQRELAGQAPGEGPWLIVRDEAEAHALEIASFRQHLGSEKTLSPGRWAARIGVRMFGPALLHANSGGNALGLGAIAALLLGLGAGWFLHPAIGLAFCALSGWLLAASEMMLRVERESLAKPPGHWPRTVVEGWLLDAAMVAILAWSLSAVPGLDMAQRLFAPAMLLAMARLLPLAVERPWVQLAADRLLLALVLAAAAAAGAIQHAVDALALGLAALAVFLPRGGSKLTPA